MDDYEQTNKSEVTNIAKKPAEHDRISPNEVESDKRQSNESASSVSSQKTKPQSRNLASKFITLVIVVAIGGLSGFGGAYFYYQKNDGQTASQQKQIISKNDNLVTSIAKRVSPSVVSITTKQLTQQTVFGGTSVAEGAGTGVVISKDGLVLTNKHVVPDGISSVSVVMSDGTKKDAQVLARDPLGDVAFLKISDVDNLSPANLGDSSQMRVGDSVVAIGNALGQFQNTVTTGIISGIGRPITAQGDNGASLESLQNLFQTDAAINPGNSGGPLVNINGQVIGINTAVAGDAQNIGFAIPINDIKSSIDSVKTSGKITRPYLGIRYTLLTPDIAKQLDIKVDNGAYVGSGSNQPSVLDGSPADKAGIRSGDIIVKVNDQTIDSTHSLASVVAQHKVGDTITLTVVRAGKNIQIKVKLKAAPSSLNQR